MALGGKCAASPLCGKAAGKSLACLSQYSLWNCSCWLCEQAEWVQMVLADHYRKICQLLLLPLDNCLLPSGHEQKLQRIPSMRQSSLACLCIFAFEDGLHQFQARATSQMSWVKYAAYDSCCCGPCYYTNPCMPTSTSGREGGVLCLLSVQQRSRQGFACFSCKTSESDLYELQCERLCQTVLGAD